MNCWVGQEIEHNLNYPNQTLFVKSASVDLDKVLEILHSKEVDNLGVSSIYLGAGEVDVECVYGSAQNIQELSNYFVVIETSVAGISSATAAARCLKCDNLVVRIDTTGIDIDKNTITLKLRNKDNVDLVNAEDYRSTDLSNLQDDGLFTGTDILVYSEE